MIINLTPVRRDDSLTVAVAGDVLTLNGRDFDLSPLAEGATLPRAAVDCEWLASDIRRSGGEIELTLILPHGPLGWPLPEGAQAVTRPAPIHVQDDGPVTLPALAPATDEVSQ